MGVNNYKIKQEIFRNFSKFIQRGIKKGSHNFLGYVENKELPDEIECLFSRYTRNIMMYDWVNGNEYFQAKLSEWQDKYSKTNKNITQKKIMAFLNN